MSLCKPAHKVIIQNNVYCPAKLSCLFGGSRMLTQKDCQLHTMTGVDIVAAANHYR
jgi:hypothetical protein